MRNSANARPEFLPSREKRIWREKWKPAVVWKCEVIGSRCLRSRSATLSLEDALRVSRQFIDHYNTIRCACTPESVTSPRRINCLVATRPSSRPVMRNFSKPGNAADRNAPHSPLYHDERCQHDGAQTYPQSPRTGRLRECTPVMLRLMPSVCYRHLFQSAYWRLSWAGRRTEAFCGLRVF
jgi:hypothetical protein